MVLTLTKSFNVWNLLLPAPSLMVLMGPLSPCTSSDSLLTAASHGSIIWLNITLMDEQTYRVLSFSASWSSAPRDAHAEASNCLQTLTHHFPCDLWQEGRGWRRWGNFLSSWVEEVFSSAGWAEGCFYPPSPHLGELSCITRNWFQAL